MLIENERLLSLIEFAQHTARLKLNPAIDVASHKNFHRFEHEMIGLPGINFNNGSESDEIWLSIDRLTETVPPEPKDKILIEWLDIGNNPDVEPALREAIESANPSQREATLILLSEHPKREDIKQKFDNYISRQWLPWSSEEKKRRRTIKLYAELFTLKQQLEGSITDTAIELAWGIGIGLWKAEKNNIKYPIITQLVELNINEKEMSIEIRPRQTEPQLESDVYMAVDNPGIVDLEKAFKDLLSKQTHAFSPFERNTYESQLQLAVAHLDPKGVYWPSQTTADDRRLPDPVENLRITDTWILFARPRSKSLFIQDLENFKKHFEQDELEVGGVAKDLVRNPQTEHTERKLPNFRGLSSFGSTYSDSKETSELYFPLPFNEEQVSIAQKLDCSNAVVVQGPPGTGKTHTIANIIAHYMALGKRVLVTSMKEPALSVLKEKLPEALQPLAISILTNEQEGMKQFEFAVSKIAQELQSLDKKKLENDIQGEERLVDQLHGKLNSIDRAITDWADANIKQILLDEKTIYPDEAAREVRSGEGNYEWLDDAITIAAKHAPQFDNNDVLKIREARRILGSDIVYLFAKFPEIDIFPEVIDLLQLHRDLMKYTEIDQLLKNNNYPSLVDGNEETFRKVESLIDAIANLEKNRKAVQNSAKSWASLMRERLQKADSAQVISIFENLLNEINECLVEKNLFLEKPILLPDNFGVLPARMCA